MRKARLSEQVVDEIDRMIREEGYGDGDKFYSENQLTAMLDVSRASVREAIRILEISGRVSVRQGRGIFIRNPLEKGFDSFAEWLKSNRGLINDHFEVRMIIESKAAARAAEKASPAEAAEMREVMKGFSAGSGCIEKLVQADRRFHQLVAKSTGNRTLYVLMNTMAESLSEGWISSLNIPGRAEKTVSEHEAVVAAIERGDADAAEAAMKKHLENALAEITDFMKNGF